MMKSPLSKSLLIKGSAYSKVLQAEMDRRKTERDPAANKMLAFYPDEGPLRRELYSKHMAFFAAGREYQERALVAGNRCGKTVVGAYETAVHLTGMYPHIAAPRRRRPRRDGARHRVCARGRVYEA